MRALLLLAVLAGPGAAMDLTEDSRRALGDEVRALLLDEPDIVTRALSAGQPPDSASIYAEEAQDDLDLIATYADMLFVPTGAGFGADTPRKVVTLFISAAVPESREALAGLIALTARDPGLRVELRAFDSSDETEALLDLMTAKGPNAMIQAPWGTAAPGPLAELTQTLGLDMAPSYVTREMMVRGAMPSAVIERYLVD